MFRLLLFFILKNNSFLDSKHNTYQSITFSLIFLSFLKHIGHEHFVYAAFARALLSGVLRLVVFVCTELKFVFVTLYSCPCSNAWLCIESNGYMGKIDNVWRCQVLTIKMITLNLSDVDV